MSPASRIPHLRHRPAPEEDRQVEGLRVMESDAIIEVLSRTVPAAGLEPIASADGMPTIYVALDQLVETCRALRDTPELRFAFLADLLPVDYLPREPRFEIVYLMASLGMAGFCGKPKRVRVKGRGAGNHPTGPPRSR